MTRSPTPTTELALIDGQPVEYRRAGRGDVVALILPGGHMSAACRFDEQSYLDLGLGVLVVSRPGYGRTAVDAGPSNPEFAVRLVGLCRRLGIDRVVPVGISLGARTAMTLAAFAPDLVERVVLMCPVSFRRWPDTRARASARLMFNRVTERATWAVLHRGLRRNPDRYLPVALAGLTTLPPAEAVRRLGPDRQAAVEFLLACRSRHGYLIDFRTPTDVTAQVRQPALVLATRLDGTVSRDHVEHLLTVLPGAQLAEVGTPSHLLWLGEGAERTRAELQAFLTA